MTGMTLRDPFFEDLFDFRRDFDRIFNRILTVKPLEEVAPRTMFSFVPAVEAYVDKEAKKYVCKISLPPPWRSHGWLCGLRKKTPSSGAASRVRFS